MALKALLVLGMALAIGVASAHAHGMDGTMGGKPEDVGSSDFVDEWHGTGSDHQANQQPGDTAGDRHNFEGNPTPSGKDVGVVGDQGGNRRLLHGDGTMGGKPEDVGSSDFVDEWHGTGSDHQAGQQPGDTAGDRHNFDGNPTPSGKEVGVVRDNGGNRRLLSRLMLALPHFQ